MIIAETKTAIWKGPVYHHISQWEEDQKEKE